MPAAQGISFIVIFVIAAYAGGAVPALLPFTVPASEDGWRHGEPFLIFLPRALKIIKQPFALIPTNTLHVPDIF